MSVAIRLFAFFERRSVRIAVTAGAALLIAASFVLMAPSTTPGDAPDSRAATAWTQTRDITYGLRAYYSDHQHYPEGDAAKIAAALKGDNPTKMIYVFEISRDATGTFIDPWAMPYRIDITPGDGSRVHSCGPDRIDQSGTPDTDDITSWR